MVQELQFTATGHYYIEIGKHVQSRDSLRSQELEEAKKVLCYTMIGQTNHVKQRKMKQFSHVRFNRLQTLL